MPYAAQKIAVHFTDVFVFFSGGIFFLEVQMAAIDLIVLGIIRQKPMSAYDIQKLLKTGIFQNG